MCRKPPATAAGRIDVRTSGCRSSSTATAGGSRSRPRSDKFCRCHCSRSKCWSSNRKRHSPASWRYPRSWSSAAYRYTWRLWNALAYFRNGPTRRWRRRTAGYKWSFIPSLSLGACTGEASISHVSLSSTSVVGFANAKGKRIEMHHETRTSSLFQYPVTNVKTKCSDWYLHGAANSVQRNYP